MKILVVENDIKQMEELIDLLIQFLNSKQLTYKIDKAYNANDILSSIHQYEFIFLDIEINNKNGIEIAQQIRKQNKDIKILFVSNYSKYLVDGYKVNAERYFLKPINKTEFFIEMEDIVKNYLLNNSYIKNDNISNMRIYIREILYIEIINRKTVIHLLNNIILESTYSLKWWKDTLSNAYFSHTHRAFLVNLQNVVSIDYNEVIFKNNIKIALSRHYKEQFQKDYYFYLNSLL